MKKLLVQYSNNKFINNILLSDTDFCEKTVSNTKGSLYKLYYTLKFNYLILTLSLLSEEENQFIEEFHKNVSIYIYNDINDSSAETSNPNVKAILQHSKPSQKSSKIITIPILVNDKIFFKQNINKNNQLVCFLDSVSELPSMVKSYLYPSSKLPIKLFNNSNISHSQNLGLLSEKDKADILQKSVYYLAINDEYVPEAWACGCKVITPEEIIDLEPKQYRYSKNFQSYVNFLKGIIRD